MALAAMRVYVRAIQDGDPEISTSTIAEGPDAFDARIRRELTENAVIAREAGIGPLDFLRRDIEAIASGHLPDAAQTPRSYEIEL